jgi:TRAP-type C4-dicarboxylate transport system substrate-binding protein
MQNNALVTGGVEQEQATKFSFFFPDSKHAWNFLDAASGDKLA